MKTKILKLAWFVLFGVFFLSYCKKDDSDPNSSGAFANVIKSGGIYENPEVLKKDSVINATPIDSVIQKEPWTCKRTHYNIIDGNAEQPMFDPNSNVIYPGNLLQGKSLNQSPPDVIVVERAGGTISYNLNNGNLVSTFTVDQVSKSSIQNAMNNIIHNAGNIIPANFVFSISEIQSEEQFAIALGVDVKTTYVKVKANMGFSSDKTYNRILVKLTQQYYTMSFDLPTSYEKLFAPTVTTQDLAKYIGSGNPATYISDVTYGRIFYMLFESTSSSQVMKATISASFNNIVAKVKGDVDVESIKTLSNLNIKVIAFGGDAKGSMTLMGVTDISKIAERMAEDTKIEAGLPLSYVVRNVYNNQIVKVKLATEYDVVNCEPVVAPDGYISDIEGNKYKIVQIGTQVWMAENLRTTKYRDGAYIPLVADSAKWRASRTHAYCYNENKTSNRDAYGMFYNWYAVNSGKLAPAGWHIPTNAEWNVLINYLGGRDYAGGLLKEAGTLHWQTPNIGATNESKFTALPGGIRNWDGSYLGPGGSAYFWTTDRSSSKTWGVFVNLWTGSGFIENRYYTDMLSGLSVRCVRD